MNSRRRVLGKSDGDARRRARAGLTLIEVLLALTILGLGLVVLLTTTARCLGVARQARHYERARQLIGRMEVEQMLKPGEDVEVGLEEGRFDRPFQAYRWQREIEAAGVEEDDGLYRIRMRVIWGEGERGAEEVETLLFAPQEGGVHASAR